MKLISLVIIKQAGISDSKFAKLLGVSRRLWGRTKNGEIPIGLTLLKAMSRTYPELDVEILTFLKDSHHD